MNPIDALFQQLRSQGRKAFIPFITAGDPDLATTAHLVRKLAEWGANLVEIGFPYSDPIADGPVIQASYTRALERGLRIDDIFTCVRQSAISNQQSPPRRLEDSPAGLKLTTHHSPLTTQHSALSTQHSALPLVAMVSYSLVHHRGPETFLDQSQAAGFSGIIVPDLPVEDAAGDAEALARLAADRDFKLIQLVTPTTPPERVVRIARLATGFLYCVSVTGITGERDRLPDELLGKLRWIRQQTDLPICVGFGISKPEHVRLLRDVADGIIVGSALVRRLEQAGTRPLDEVVAEISSLVQSLVTALNA